MRGDFFPWRQVAVVVSVIMRQNNQLGYSLDPGNFDARDASADSSHLANTCDGGCFGLAVRYDQSCLQWEIDVGAKRLKT